MARFLFATLDAGGNLPPALGIGHELLCEGHQVRFLGHPRQAAAIEASGAEFVPYRDAAPLDPAADVPAHRQFAAMLRVFGDAGAGRDLVAEARAMLPDVVVVDCLLLGAIRAAAEAGLRPVVLVHSFFAFFDGPFRRGPMGVALALRRLPPGPVLRQAALVLVCADPALDPAGPPAGATGLGAAGPVWSGAVVDGVEPGQASGAAGQAPPPAPGRTAGPTPGGGPPEVLASLSTTAFPGQRQVLQNILDAAAALPITLTVTTGPAVDPAELSAPPNATVHRYVDHLQLMPRCSAVIGHGGHATTMRALAHGLPLMILPMHPLMDQPMIGKAVRDAGAGVLLRRTSPPEQIAAALAALLGSERHRQAAELLGARLRAADGARTGARMLAELAGPRSPAQ